MNEITIKKRSKNLIITGLCLSSMATMFLISGSGIFAVAVFTEFNAMEIFSLIFILEALSRSLTLPVAGKLGDLFGRKKIYLFGVGSYVLFLALCGISTNVVMFLIFKSLIGVSWGLFFSNTFSIVSDIYDKDESPKYLGYLQAVNNATLIFSPAITGILIDQLSWRWNFYVGIPLLAIAFFLVFVNLPVTRAADRKSIHEIDVPGIFAVVLAAGPVCFLMALGGTMFNWISLISLILILLTIIGVFLLIKIERQSHNPLFPIKLFSYKMYMTVFFATTVYAVYQAASFFIPLFIQTELGLPSTISGLVLMPSYILASSFSMLCGYYIARNGINGLLVNLYWIVCVTGGVLFFSFLFGTTLPFVILAASFMGIGMGFNQVIPISFSQTRLKPEEIGTGISFINFGQGLATSLGSSISGILLVYGADKVLASTLISSLILMLIILIGFRNINKRIS